MGARTRDDTLQLAEFADRLREVLGLDPLYNDGASAAERRTEATDLYRFYSVYEDVDERMWGVMSGRLV